MIFPQTDLHHQIFNYLDLYQKNGLKISFEYIMDSDHFTKKIDCEFYIDRKKYFKFKMGPKILFFNGSDFRTYDSRTNQLFIQNIDYKFLSFIENFFDKEYVSSLNVKKNTLNNYSFNFNEYNIEIISDSIFYNASFKNGNITSRLNKILINEFESEVDFSNIEKSDIFRIDMRSY